MDVTAPELLFAAGFARAAEVAGPELLAAPVRWPVPSRLAAPLVVPGAKPAAGAAALGLHTVGDLLEHLPSGRRDARAIAELVDGETATLVVEVRRITSRPVRRRGMRPLVDATVADTSGTLRVTFFQQPWLVSRYRPGTRLVLHGKFDERRGFTVQGHAPSGQSGLGALPRSDGEDGGLEAAVAHYPATEGLSSTQLLALIREHAGAIDDVVEPLPGPLRRRERLPDRPSAVRAAHFGTAVREFDSARRRLAFDELLYGQLVWQQRRRLRAEAALAGGGAPRLTAPRSLTGRWLADGLPFALTADQRAAIEAIDADIGESTPMQRLLMGEVGSGKTVVALYAMLRAFEHGHQAALMAPTETLAEQHFATIQRLLGAELVAAALLTGSTPAGRRTETLARLASGELPILVGTHALIEESVGFQDLAVVVVDEQHRFGVAQRARLDARGGAHTLHMTATPIPRTLALLGHGDLDVTMLRELPGGRKPITTRVCASDAERARAYELIRSEVRAGRQAFVVCPLVEESASLAARAATAEFERLRTGELRDFSVVLLHGQMRAAEKAEAMARFADGAADVLVATTVIEVGIDVPNATVMLVEDANRYGISQLHQLRGRIGRGGHASTCLLFGRPDAVRLAALAREDDGFRLAEIDLRLRGEGELAGTRQSGTADYRFVVLPDDRELLERAARAAREICDADPWLRAPEHALLAGELRARFGAEVDAPLPA